MVGLQVEQNRKHEFIKVDFVLKKSPLAGYVHMERFVEFNPTKIRGRIFLRRGGCSNKLIVVLVIQVS